MFRTISNFHALIAAALLAGCGGQAETDAVINAAQARFQAQAAQAAERAMPQAGAAQESPGQASATAATMGQPAQPALSEAEALAAPMPIPAADIDAPANDPPIAGANPGVDVASGEAGTPHP